MKTYTIGRDPSCRIPINDIRISRQHAIIRVYTFGKMEIVDLAKNGTWVNGVKLRPNIPFPVKRKDVVNLGNAVQLDWSYVPDPLKYVRIGIISIVAIIAVIIAICFFSNLLTDDAPIVSGYESGRYAGSSQSDGNVIVQDSLNSGKKTDALDEDQPRAKKEPKKKTLDELFPQKRVEKKDSAKGGKETPKSEEKTKKPKEKNKDNPQWGI